MPVKSRVPGRPYSLTDNVRYLTREDCATCWARRDKEHNRMPVGWCSDACLMARIRRGEHPPYVVVN